MISTGSASPGLASRTCNDSRFASSPGRCKSISRQVTTVIDVGSKRSGLKAAQARSDVSEVITYPASLRP